MDYARYIKWIPDKIFLQLKYRYWMGHRLHLENPKTFAEKLQWMKIYDRNPIYVTMVDKYDAKEYVGNLIGEEYIVPTYGVWNSFKEIDFDSLPDSFALKCTHDSGGNVMVSNKKNMNIVDAKKKIERCLGYNYFYHNREWSYNNVKPRVLAEEFLDNDGQEMVDYKFFCFGGIPKFLYVSQGMTDHTKARMCFMKMDWTPAPFTRKDYKAYEGVPEKPVCFDEMVEIAKRLSKGYRFLRIDLYCHKGRVYFSEITILPNGGFMHFYPEKYNRIIGSWLDTSHPYMG